MVLGALGEHDAAVWLFGSCARGDARQHSDIDIAILPRDDLPSGFFGELNADIEESTIPYEVDLVDLRNADPVLIAEMVKSAGCWINAIGARRLPAHCAWRNLCRSPLGLP
jgi:hypothetical protein